MTILDLGVLAFVAGTLIFTGIWYVKEQVELPKHRPDQEPDQQPKGEPACAVK
ncbi:hypothetical protein C8P63_12636 [Melghirimyces profundicolus]|uniref:Uncharacterized protein n=1 Tax=Melghirimyces profundicolus TaxID=1242148 RepID=A0A2T6BCE0_9BACL|nr:hypothetical protein [Melghirimyces profundicolus]PTX53748.1 hypothetical protein C8P63_12636 [Melghirimyces profundicolus]